jgi:hypothetical protein
VSVLGLKAQHSGGSSFLRRINSTPPDAKGLKVPPKQGGGSIQVRESS